MARGDSWDDPIIIGENATTPAEVWADFMSKKWSGTAGQCMRFKDIHLDENGEFDISGSGTYSDPYIVSTYNEMLHATGAAYSYQCKLVQDEDHQQQEISPTEPRLYVYINELTGATTYCSFNPTPTTINFNDIYEESINPIETNCKIDVNGWTWLNLRVNCSQNGAFYADYDYNNANSYYANLILLNCQMAATGNGVMSMFSARFDTSIIQAVVTYNDSGYLYWYYSSQRSNHNFYKCAVKLTIDAPNATVYACAYSGTMYAADSTLDLDITAGAIANRSAYFDTERCVFKGNIKAINAVNYFFGANGDTIFDISDSEGRWIKAPIIHERCVFNSDKIDITYNPSEGIDRHSDWRNQTGLSPFTSEQLFSPTALQAAGLLIGVDTQ